MLFCLIYFPEANYPLDLRVGVGAKTVFPLSNSLVTTTKKILFGCTYCTVIEEAVLLIERIIGALAEFLD